MEYVELNLASHYTNPSCGDTNWDYELSIAILVGNTGSYYWTVSNVDPSCKEFAIDLFGIKFIEQMEQIIASDESDGAFEIGNGIISTVPIPPLILN